MSFENYRCWIVISSFRHMLLVFSIPLYALFFPLFAQEADTLGMGIHQFESEQHRWDVLKLDSGIPAFSKGKEYASKKLWRQAKNEFLTAVKYDAADAYFNVGILFYHQDKLKAAKMYLKKSFSLKKDSLTHWYLNEIGRRSFPKR